MKKSLVGVLACSLILALAFMSSFSAFALAGEAGTAPIAHNNAKWRFAYYQGGPYVDYQTILKAVVNGFIDLGWIPPANLPAIDDPQDTRTLWTWLSKNINSPYIEFVEDAYYSADWDKEKRPKNKAELIARLNGKKDIDYVLAFGTWAGQDLANNEHSTPIEVISTSDPLGSGIIKSNEDSGYDHVHAKVEPTRYEKQVRLFNDIIPFKRLGVVYEDTKEGKTYAAIDKVETVAKERGFEIVSCFAPFSGVSEQEAAENVQACHNKLASETDAVYITVHRGVNTKTLGKLLAPLNQHKIPTFSQSGSPEVKCGVLLSIAQAAFKYAGKFHAESIAKVLNGAKPRSLPQIFDAPPKIAINLVTAQLIGYDPPVDLLGAADEIYNTVEGTPQGE